MLEWWQSLGADLQEHVFTCLRIVLIVAIATAVWLGVGRGLGALTDRLEQSARGTARGRTISGVARWALDVVLLGVTLTLVLAEVGVSLAPILATAGVAGVAIGFGAQWLVKDLLQGFSLLLEDQIREGEVVEIAGQSGVVEEVTLRYVRLRDLEGNVLFVPSGEITVVKNMTREFAYALIEVGVAYATDVAHALEVLGDVLAELRADDAWKERLPEPPEVLGVEALASSSVNLRARIKVVPAIERWAVRRELHRRVKVAFDRAGIEIPFPQLTLHDPSGARAPRGATDEDPATDAP